MINNSDNSEHQHLVIMDTQGAHRMHELQMLEMKNTMDNFIDSLGPEQCISLTRMLQAIHSSPNYLHVVVGQLVALLRAVHKVCASCGDTKHSTMEHIAATDGGLAPGPADLGFLVGLSTEDQMRKLNVVSDTAQVLGAAAPMEVFICRNCETAFMSLLDRAQSGKMCPVCQDNKIALEGRPDSELDLGDLMTRYGVADSYVNEDGVFCLGCDTEFPVLKHRMKQGIKCPVCEIKTEESDEGPSRAS